MIESYQIEILKKRRNARWFWATVFAFAFLLYFFFQGYYPDIRLGLSRMFSEEKGLSETGVTQDLIKSFGIINIKVIPTTAQISLGSGSYGNNEKRMSNYDTYELAIEQDGYIKNTLSFVIDKEKPYFIEEMSLLETPRYTALTGVTALYPTSSDTPLYESSLGLSYSGKVILRRDKNGSLKLTPLVGGRYFGSGNTIIQWNENTWRRIGEERENFIKTCPDITWKYGVLSCPQYASILTSDDRYLTGVLDIRQHTITLSGSYLGLDRGRIQTTIRTPKSSQNLLTLLDDILYSTSGGVLSPIQDGDAETIITPLDSISLVQYVGTELVILGKKDNQHILLIRHRKDPIDRTRSITLPEELDYSDIEFHDRKGNLFIQLNTALLFVYRASDTLEWIVDGTILTSTDGDVIYRTSQDEIWQATWDILLP